MQTHSDVWRALRRGPDLRREAAGDQFNQLRQMRNRADYDPTIEGNLSKQARDAIELARAVIEALEGTRTAPR